ALMTFVLVTTLLRQYRRFTDLVGSRLRAERLGAENLRLANLDSLTRLPTRRAFFGALVQEHRLRTVVAPWLLDQRVFRAADGRVAASAEEAAVLSPGQEVAEVPLLEVLPDLTKATGTVLEFVAGTAEERLNAEFGGLAGLKRF